MFINEDSMEHFKESLRKPFEELFMEHFKRAL